MRRIQADDIRAFEMLYDRYSARALGLTRVLCGSSHRAEEAVQEGFLAVWRNRASFDPARGSTCAWLLTVMRYRSFDLMRRVRREDRLRVCIDELGEPAAPGSVDDDDDADERAETGRVRRSLLALPVAQREVIVLAYFGGLTHTEIAAHLQLPAGTVKGRMRLGLQKVRAEINPAVCVGSGEPVLG